jgi:hypothetical protein
MVGLSMLGSEWRTLISWTWHSHLRPDKRKWTREDRQKKRTCEGAEEVHGHKEGKEVSVSSPLSGCARAPLDPHRIQWPTQEAPACQCRD